MRATFIQSLVLLTILSLCVLAVPTPADTAKRSFTSAGTTCYYTCPSSYSTVLGTLTLVSGTTVLGVGVCYYSLGLVSYTCQYSSSTGSGILTNSDYCPGDVTTYSCGTQPSNSFRKRGLPERDLKERTPLEKRLAVRQYKFKRNAEGKAAKRALTPVADGGNEL